MAFHSRNIHDKLLDCRILGYKLVSPETFHCGLVWQETRLCSCDKSSYIRSVYSQYHVDLLKCIEQNVNNQSLTQVSQLYVHVSFCLKVIKSWLNLPTGGHGHMICMGVMISVFLFPPGHRSLLDFFDKSAEILKIIRAILYWNVCQIDIIDIVKLGKLSWTFRGSAKNTMIY